MRRITKPDETYYPTDLQVIPFAASLDDDDATESIRTALYATCGNTHLAAEMLDCAPGDLARRIELIPSLKADRDAARRMIVDSG